MIQYKGKAAGSIADRTPTVPRPVDVAGAASPGGSDSAYADFSVRGGSGIDVGRLDSWCASYEATPTPVDLFRDAHLSAPEASSGAEGRAALPDVGGEFCGFKLVAELGRGAFGRVFLSHQGDLADRPVALKVSTEIREESQKLARLQHTNIVPIYSFHRQGTLQAVCMPYFGSATLADVATELSRRDSLPASGKMVASTVFDRRSRTLRTADSRIRPASERPAPPVAPTAERAAPVQLPAPATQELKRLEGLTYVETILWIGARLADGLAHAHDRGILHRDLKPANVLLTDDGQPMLLDFNLSEDLGKTPDASVAQVGGTLPYMAPEHLEAFGGTWRELDSRCDVYSLGVVLYELLTGRAPFTRRTGPPETIVPEMIAERAGGAPGLRRYNKAVSPAAEAIVRKCMEPEPARRYQTARQLQEDLERHLDNLPLRHQPEPSWRERGRKWVRRHTWVYSTGVLTTVASVVIVALAAAAFGWKERSENNQALRQYAEFQQDSQAARVLLYARPVDRSQGDHAQEDEGRAAARRALDRYGVLENGAWGEQSAVRRLPQAERESLSLEVGQLLVLLAGSVLPEKDASPADKAEALRLNRLAEACFDGESTPRALWAQRAELIAEPAEARRLRELADQTPVREGWDHYLAASAFLRAGKIPRATAEAREAARLDPNSFAAWFLLGNCYQGAGSKTGLLEAIVHYKTCASLRPDFYGSYFNRGLAYLALTTSNEQENRENIALAEGDFAKVTEMRPGFAEAHLQLAIARERSGKFREALAEADRALAAGIPPGRVYFVRARLRERLGDRDGANRDLAAGFQQTPTDCRGWIDRGMARLEQGNLDKALADFAAAQRSNPNSREAIHDQAYVLGEQMNRPAEAIALLSRELELYPDHAVTLVSRGVYYARTGNRTAAISDARRAAALAPGDGGVLYRVACVYALASRTAPDPKADRRLAIRYLAGALEQGFGFDYVEVDNDLAPLVDEPDFVQLKKLTGQTHKLKL